MSILIYYLAIFNGLNALISLWLHLRTNHAGIHSVAMGTLLPASFAATAYILWQVAPTF